jgi:hypothetical protein
MATLDGVSVGNIRLRDTITAWRGENIIPNKEIFGRIISFATYIPKEEGDNATYSRPEVLQIT